MVSKLADLLDPASRARAIGEVSALLRIDTFLIFLLDPELNKLLAAPGFPQTFPDRKAWQEFLAQARIKARHEGMLPWPTPESQSAAVGLKIGPAAVVIMLGGGTPEDVVVEFSGQLKLVIPALALERTVETMSVQIELAREVSRESSALAKGLDEARRAAQAEVAARREAEQALQAAKDELSRINLELEGRVRDRTQKLQDTIKELEAFSYTVSHDLRSPLRAMYGYANALLEEAIENLRPEHQQHLHRIARAAERLDHLILDVLRYTRVARTEINLHSVDLEKAVREVIAEHPSLQKLGNDLKLLSPFPRVLGHDMLLNQCLSNLLLNAVKFVAPGAKPTVTIGTEPAGEYVRFWVQDNGIGIAPEHLPRLFGMFERIHPASKFEGNGIGLAIVERAAQRMDGGVGVESQPGEGSRFWLDLRPAC